MAGEKIMTVASNVSQCIAQIKGIEAQLSTFALNSMDPDAQRIFHQSMIIFQEIMSDLEKRRNELELAEPQYKKN